MTDELTHIMVVGTSEPQDFLLLNNGAAVVGTSLTVGLEWRGTAPAGTFSVSWLDAPAGKVRVTGTGSMVIGIYPFRFTLTDGGGAKGYCPNRGAHQWRVVAV